MRTEGKREELDGDVRLFAGLDEVRALLAHHGGRADDAVKDCFVQDGPQGGGVLAGFPACLAFHAYLDQCVDLIGSEIRTHLGDDGASVVLGLEQAGNEQGLVAVRLGGTCFQGWVTVVAGRSENRGVCAPPGLLLLLVGTHEFAVNWRRAAAGGWATHAAEISRRTTNEE
nr:hypothetical protein [Streptomyces sp. AC512_CC834]